MTDGGQTQGQVSRDRRGASSAPPPNAPPPLAVYLWPLLLFLGGIGLSYENANLRQGAAGEQLRSEARADLESVGGPLAREIFGAMFLTTGLAGTVAVEGGLSEEKFRALASELLGRSELVRDVALAPNNVISRVYPVRGNEPTLGFDLASSPTQWPSVERMMRERRMVIAGPFELVQGGLGVIGRTPIYVPDPSRGPEGRRYWGLTSTVVDFQKLLARTPLQTVSGWLRVGLRGIDGSGDSGPVFWGDPAVFEDSPVVLDVPLPAGSYRMAAVPRAGWPTPRAWSAYLLGGTLLSAVLAALLLQMLRLSESRRRHVAKQRLQQSALAESEQRYRTTLESIMEGCQLLDYDWRYLYLNDAVERHNRRPNAALLGKTMLECWPGIEQTPVFAMLRRSMTERLALHDEIDFHFPDGQQGWFDVRVQPVPEGIFVLSIDISERKRAESALLELNESLERKIEERTVDLHAARERAEAADRLKSAFLATMSHELRTPLNSILGFTGIVLQGLAGPLGAEQQKQLGMVQSSARHLLDLINDVLDISRIEAGQLEIRAAPFDLRAALERAAASVAPLADKKGLTLRVSLAESLGAMESDRRRFEQIVLNLLNNAIKFTDRGTVTLTGALVDDGRGANDGASAPAARVVVADTGIGMKNEHLSVLFQPFRQIDSGLQRQHEGTGLGLAICRRLVGLLGGTISVESVWGEGSVFTVTIPMKRG